MAQLDCLLSICFCFTFSEKNRRFIVYNDIDKTHLYTVYEEKNGQDETTYLDC
jgi:hypothetical protein